MIPEVGRGAFILASTRPSSMLQYKTNLSVKQPSKALDVKMPGLCFMTFKLQDLKKSMHDINPFYVQRSLDDIAGKVRNVT
jgi:hypothetical protein